MLNQNHYLQTDSCFLSSDLIDKSGVRSGWQIHVYIYCNIKQRLKAAFDRVIADMWYILITWQHLIASLLSILYLFFMHFYLKKRFDCILCFNYFFRQTLLIVKETPVFLSVIWHKLNQREEKLCGVLCAVYQIIKYIKRRGQ